VMDAFCFGDSFFIGFHYTTSTKYGCPVYGYIIDPLGNMTEEVATRGLDFFCRLVAEDPEQFDLEKTIVFYKAGGILKI